jgi:hypothetical protein
VKVSLGPKSLGAACLIFCIFLRAGGPGNLVLCFGDDGHVALEIARHGACFSRTDGQEAPPADAPVVNDEGLTCCQCFDIPVSLNGPLATVQPSKRLGLAPNGAPVPATLPLGSLPVYALGQQTLSRFLPQESRDFHSSALHTVVLLC